MSETMVERLSAVADDVLDATRAFSPEMLDGMSIDDLRDLLRQAYGDTEQSLETGDQDQVLECVTLLATIATLLHDRVSSAEPGSARLMVMP